MKETRISVLCGQMLSTAILLTSIGLAIPRLAEDIGLTYSMRGNLISAQYFGATTAVVVGGILSDKYGKMFITKAFMLGSALVSVFFGIVWNYPSALIAIFLLGAVSLILEIAIMSSGLDLGEKSRVGNSLIQTSFSVGAIIVPLLYLACMHFGQWRPVYYFLAVIFIIGFVFSKGSPEKMHSESLWNMIKKFGMFLSKPSYLIGPVFVFLYVAAEIGLWGFAPTFFESAGYGPLSGIISTILIWVMMLVGRIIGTVLIKKTTIMRILIPFGLCGIVAFASIMIFGGNVALFCTAAAGFMCAPFYSILTSLSIEVSGDNSSSYIAFTMGMGTLGAALLGSVGGAAAQVFGPRFVILPALVSFTVLVTSLIIFSIYSRSSRKRA